MIELFIVAEIAVLIALYLILRPLRAKNIEERERRYSVAEADKRLQHLRKFQRNYTSIGVSESEGVSPSALSSAIYEAADSMEELIVENDLLKKKLDGEA